MNASIYRTFGNLDKSDLLSSKVPVKAGSNPAEFLRVPSLNSIPRWWIIWSR